MGKRQARIVVHHADGGHGYVHLEFTIGRPQCLFVGEEDQDRSYLGGTLPL